MTQDLTSHVEIRRCFAIAAGTVQPVRIPFEIIVGGCWFRFNADAAFAHLWRHEMSFLFEWAIVVYQQTFHPG